MKDYKRELYEAMDSFLVETDKQRSIIQLNQDRHLFVERVEKIIQEVREETIKEITDIAENVIKEERFSGTPYALNKLIKLINKC